MTIREFEQFGVICLAVHQPAPDLLKRQIESIISQTLRSWTCVIAVDGSDPVTEGAVADLVDGDPRFQVEVFENNVGFYRNFERCLAAGLELSPAWIALADQDDYWHSGKLGAQVAELLDTADVMLCLADALVTDATGAVEGRAIRRPTSMFELLVDNFVTGSFSVFKPDVARRALPFPEPTPAAYHDHWIGACAHSLGRITSLEQVLQEYVQHDANVIGEAGSGGRAHRLQGIRASGLRETLKALRDERWAWRRRMANELLERSSHLDVHNRRVLSTVAHTPPSPSLVLFFLRALRRGRVDRLRSLALMIGAGLSWRTK
ncbi:glycosyltransferase [Aeromicrobium sp. 50.2.37]|uniref:glycosyltransferase n=1 Tax=Aeromicrobium sp. 50.2.37 TaxID=2969305 RepID=UPI00214FAC69|nr:glycosyltransferase [Aeromicrobium sp. 50.2.37]MCR4513041.1 glycosyltransferase [Aeromicrobium sp. 50.2.37]